MIQQGKVLSVSGDTAVVEIIRESACSSCHNKGSCGAGVIAGCSRSEKVEVTALNTAKAEPGQTVELTSDSAKTLGIAFSVFILPILIAIGAYFAVLFLSENTAISYAAAAAAFAVSFFALFFGIDRRLSKRINVEITSIIEQKSQ